MPVMKSDTVVHDGVAIPYSYCRSRRKTLEVTVRPDGTVSVRAPLRATVADMRDFVSRKGPWIARVRQRFAGLASCSAKALDGQAQVRFQGRDYPLLVRRGTTEAVSFDGGTLVVHIVPGHDAERLTGLINAWYRERAAALFSERIGECHARMGAEAIPLPSLVIRDMRSRWGSYSRRTGRVSLNLKLVRVPLPCLDYVIVHELCHVKIPNHGPRFWELVSRYVPDHAELRRQLRSSVMF